MSSISEVFRVGVALSVTGVGFEVLKALSAHLSKADKDVNKLKGSLSKLHIAMGAAAFAGVGVGILVGLKSAADAGEGLVKQQELLRDRGWTNVEIARATADAYAQIATNIGGIPSITLRSIGELKSQFGSLDIAEKILPTISKLGQIAGSLSNKPVDPERLNLDTIKLLEARGAIYKDINGNRQVDQAKVNSELEALNRTLLASNGLIGVRELLQQARQGGMATRAMSQDAFYGWMPEVGIALGASKAGTAMMSMFQQLEVQAKNHTMPKAIQHNLSKIGMMDANGTITDEKLFQSNPVLWVQEAVAKIKAKNPKLDETDAMIQLMGIFGRNTTQREAAEMMENFPQLKQFFDNYNKAKNIDQTFLGIQSKDLHLAEHNLGDSMTGLWEAFMSPAIPTIVAYMNKLRDCIKSATVWAGDPKNEETVKLIIKVTAGLGALFALGGAMVLFGLALPPFIIALQALTAITGLKAFGTGLVAVGDVLTAATAGVTIAGALIAVSMGFDAVEGALKTLDEYMTNPEAFWNRMGTAFGVTPYGMNKKKGHEGEENPPPAPHHIPNTHTPGVLPRYNAPVHDGRRDRDSYLTLSKPPAPNVTVTTNVTLDSKAIAAAVETRITNDARAPIGGPTGVDTKSTYLPSLLGVGF